MATKKPVDLIESLIVELMERVKDCRKSVLRFGGGRRRNLLVIVTVGLKDILRVEDVVVSSVVHKVRPSRSFACFQFSNTLLKTETAVLGFCVPASKPFFKGVNTMGWNLGDTHDVVETGTGTGIGTVLSSLMTLLFQRRLDFVLCAIRC